MEPLLFFVDIHQFPVVFLWKNYCILITLIAFSKLNIRLGVPKLNHFVFSVFFLFETDFWWMTSP